MGVVGKSDKLANRTQHIADKAKCGERDYLRNLNSGQIEILTTIMPFYGIESSFPSRRNITAFAFYFRSKILKIRDGHESPHPSMHCLKGIFRERNL